MCCKSGDGQTCNCKTEDGDGSGPGGNTSGIQTINGDNTAAQLIVGVGVTVNTTGGTTTITGTGPATLIAFSANTTSVLSISTATSTLVPWSNINYDTSSGWNAGTNQYTIPTTGYYFITSNINFDNSIDAYDAQISIVIGGSSTFQTGEMYHAAISSIGNPFISGTFFLSATNTVQINCYQNSGFSIPLLGIAVQTSFCINKLN